MCVSNLIIIGSDNGLSPARHQAISESMLDYCYPLGTNFSEILIEILTFSFKEMRLKVSFAKWWPFCLGLNVLKIRQGLGVDGVECRSTFSKCALIVLIFAVQFVLKNK